MFEKLAKIIEMFASWGAGTVSSIASYQPKTPKSMLKK